MPSNCQPLSSRSRIAWRGVQTIVWLVGLAIFCLLLFRPPLGLAAFWNVLIPVAPALLVFAPGLWRNVCPLGVTALAARHLGLSARRELSARARVWLNLIGVVALFSIVFWRRVELNTSATATATVLAGTAILSVFIGMIFEWKSGWCSGLCPIHAVEKLYGSKPLVSFPNAHCDACQRCSSPCPDSTNAMHPMLGPEWRPQILAEALVVGAFPGFVWGWFHVPDWAEGSADWQEFGSRTYLPFAGMAATFLLFAVLRSVVAKKHELHVVRVFAASTVSCYYWFRIPALLGYGVFPGDGTLINLGGKLPDWWVAIPRMFITGIFVWWLVLHKGPKRHWAHRPPMAASAVVPNCTTEARTTTCPLGSHVEVKPTLMRSVASPGGLISSQTRSFDKSNVACNKHLK